MSSRKRKEIWIIIVAGFSAAIAIICALFSIIILRTLLTPWWIPVAIIIPIALVLALPLRKASCWVTESSREWVNICHSILLLYPILLFAMLFINHLCPAGESTSMEAIIESKYTETRYRSERVSRRVYRSVPYRGYAINAITENGKIHTFPLSYKEYNAVHKGDTIDIPVSIGIFRIKSLEVADMKVRHPRALSKRKKTKYFGTGNKENTLHSAQEVVQRNRERIDSIRQRADSIRQRHYR